MYSLNAKSVINSVYVVPGIRYIFFWRISRSFISSPNFLFEVLKHVSILINLHFKDLKQKNNTYRRRVTYIEDHLYAQK